MARFSMALRGGFFAVLLCAAAAASDSPKTRACELQGSWLFFNLAMVFKAVRLMFGVDCA